MQQPRLQLQFSSMGNSGPMTETPPAQPQGQHWISPTFWLEDGFNFLQKSLFHKGWGWAAHAHRKVLAVHIKHDGIVLGWRCRRERRDSLSRETEMSHTWW